MPTHMYNILFSSKIQNKLPTALHYVNLGINKHQYIMRKHVAFLTVFNKALKSNGLPEMR